MGDGREAAIGLIGAMRRKCLRAGLLRIPEESEAIAPTAPPQQPFVWEQFGAHMQRPLLHLMYAARPSFLPLCVPRAIVLCALASQRTLRRAHLHILVQRVVA